MEKTAKEMFEELGFDISNVENFGLFYKIKDYPLIIIFDLEEKHVRIVEEHYIGELGLYEYLPIYYPITVELHKAIHKQMQELGWI